MTTIPADTTTPEVKATSRDQTFGILSLITAIVSIVAGFVPLGSALAIVLGALSMRREPANKLATAGILIGAISIALTVGLSVLIPFGVLTALPFGLFGFWF